MGSLKDDDNVICVAFVNLILLTVYFDYVLLFLFYINFGFFAFFGALFKIFVNLEAYL